MQPVLQQAVVGLDLLGIRVGFHAKHAVGIGLCMQQHFASIELRGFLHPRFRFARIARGLGKRIGHGAGGNAQQTIHT